MLLQRAHDFINAGQPMLDLDVPEPAHRISQVADWRTGRLPAPPQHTAAEPAGRGRIAATASLLIYDVLAAVYDRLGFDGIDDAVFRDLVIARIVEPTSKTDARRVLADLGVAPVSYKTIQRHLGRITPDRYRDVLADRCFEYSAATGGLALVLYDVTTLYFEAENEDNLRKVGYSKERRVDPQIVVGLLVDRCGFPLEIGCYEGNRGRDPHHRADDPPVPGAPRHRRCRNVSIAADAGMLSASNLTSLDAAGLKFIVGSRTVKAPGDLASHFHWHGDYFTDGQLIDTVTPRNARSQVNDIKRRAEPVWDPQADTKSWRAVWHYSATRARRDNKTLTAQENRARDVIDGRKSAKSPRFVTATKTGRRLDEAALARARRLVGLKGYVTNLSAQVMGPSEVLAKYHDLWHVEQSFRMSKTDLRARPMFHRRRDAIEAHLTLVFAALAVSRVIQNDTGLSIRKVVKTLRPLRHATVVINGATQQFPPRIPDAERGILDQLHVEPGY